MEIISPAAIRAATSYNKAEVRFNLLNPLLRQLGYPGTEGVYPKLEEVIEYPYIHIGHRSQKDVPMSKPDYRAGLMAARGSFTVEAKAGAVKITRGDIEQGHSYAAHAQVGANYFVIGNGSEIRVYETLSGPDVEPILRIPISEVNGRFHEFENVLGPVALAKNCRISYDSKLKLCEGLGSSIRLTGGEYKFVDYSFRILINGQEVTAILRTQQPQLAVLDQKLSVLRDNFDLKISRGSARRRRSYFGPCRFSRSHQKQCRGDEAYGR